MKIGLSRNQYKYLTSILITIFLIFGGTIAGIYYHFAYTGKMSVEFDVEFSEQIAENKLSQAKDNAAAFDAFLSQIEAVEKTLNNYILKLLDDNSPSGRPSYYHNMSEADLYRDPLPTLVNSSKHNKTLDYDVSAYYVPAIEGGYKNWSQEINNSISIFADLDPLFKSLFSTMGELFWIYFATETGVHRTYPWHGPFSSSYDPRARPWYETGKSSDSVAFTSPFVDATTGRVIITAALAVRYKDEFIGVIGIDFLLSTLIEQLNDIDLGDENGRSFLMNYDGKIIAHPSFNESDPANDPSHPDFDVAKTNISYYETDSADFFNLIEIASQGSATQSIPPHVNYGGSSSNQIVTLVPLENADMILGLAVKYEIIHVKGGPDFMDLLLIPIILEILIFGVVFFFLKKMKIINISLDNLSGLGTISFKDIKSKVKSKVSRTEEELIEMAQEKIKETGDELIEKAIDRIEEEKEKLVDKVEAVEEKVLAKVEDLAENVEDRIEGISEEAKEKIEDFESLVTGKFDAVVDMAIKLQALEKFVSKGKPESVNELAPILGIDEAIMNTWVNDLPEEYGLSTKDGNVKIDQDKAQANLPEIMASYNNIAKAENLFEGNLESVTEMITKMNSIEALLQKDDAIMIDRLASALEVDTKDLKSWIEVLPPDYGIRLDFQMVSFDQDKMTSNIANLVNSFLLK